MPQETVVCSIVLCIYLATYRIFWYLFRPTSDRNLAYRKGDGFDEDVVTMARTLTIRDETTFNFGGADEGFTLDLSSEASRY